MDPSRTSPQAPCTVVGAGVVGLACALELARRGIEVTVVDAPGPRPAASLGNAGHIATEQVDPLASPAALRSAIGRLYTFGGALSFRPGDVGHWLPWAMRYVRASTASRHAAARDALTALLARALPAWQRLAATLSAPSLVLANGHLVVWESPRRARAGLAAWRRAPLGTTTFEPLDAAALDAVAAPLRVRLYGGVRFSGTAQVADPIRIVEALRAALAARGVRVIDGRARSLQATGRGVRLVLADGSAIDAPRVLVAAGVGSAGLMRDAGHPTPLIAERGYHVEAGHAGDAPALPVVFEDRSMIVTPFGARLRAASFVEFAREQSPPDPGKWRRLERHVAELGLPMHSPLQRWFGARPTLPDYLPAIGRSTLVPGLHYAFGHQHLGLTLAAVTAEIAGDLLADGASPVPLTPFAIERFA